MTKTAKKVLTGNPTLTTTFWGYNGIFPGPTIVATRTAKILVRQINDLGRDDTLQPIPTSIHLHGGHQCPEDDGHPLDSFSPGEFRDYIYPNSDHRATTLWYHDHTDDITGRNVYMGLAGFYILKPAPGDFDFDLQTKGLPTGLSGDPAVAGTDARDIPLVIQDRFFNADGSLFFPDDPDGVIGDTVLVNGAVQPKFEVATVKYRFRFLNGSNARAYELKLIPFGATDPVPVRAFQQIGSDQGLLPERVDRDTILISPAERMDVVVDFSPFPVGTRLILHDVRARDSPDGRRAIGGSPADIMRFDVTTAQPDPVGDVPTTLFPLRPNLESFVPSLDMVRREFKFERSGGAWAINGQLFDHGTHIQATPNRDNVEIWDLVNSSGGWAHPIHIHDIPFQTLLRNEAPPHAWEAGLKDTFFLGPGESVQVIGKFTDNLGVYVFHCHNIEHEDMFMMSQFQVVRPAGT